MIDSSSSLTLDGAAEDWTLPQPLPARAPSSLSESFDPPALDEKDPYLPSRGGSRPGLRSPEVPELKDRIEDDEGALRREWFDRGRWRDASDEVGDRRGSTIVPDEDERLNTGAESSVNGVKWSEVADVSGEYDGRIGGETGGASRVGETGASVQSERAGGFALGAGRATGRVTAADADGDSP